MGPLSDLRVVELASIGPGPHAMVLGDFEVNDELVYARMTGWGQHRAAIVDGRSYDLRGHAPSPGRAQQGDSRRARHL